MESVDFNKCLGTYITINRRHITKIDWGFVSPTYDDKGGYSTSAWKKVPEEDPDLYRQCILDGSSFSYPSILQQCRRNNIDWILFTDDIPLIAGLKSYEDDWS